MNSSQNTAVTTIRRIKIPPGLEILLEEIIRAVLKARPKNVHLFIADHLKMLIQIRDQAATGSVQTSPSDIVKHIVDYERKTESDTSKIPTVSGVSGVSGDDSSPVNDEEEADSENAERGSLHCVEATAVRTLAASTGTVAILGTTAKYNENVDYRRSVHSEHAYVFDRTDDEPQERDHIASSESDEAPRHDAQSIVTTAIIEAPPVAAASIEQDMNDTVTPHDENVHIISQKVVCEVETAAKTVVDRLESDLPKVVHSIEKVTMRKKASVDSPPSSSLDIKPSVQAEIVELIDATATTPDDKMNENSDLESTTNSDALSVINSNEPYKKPDRGSGDFALPKQMSFDASRPNRLSLGQMSIESDQNTLEISSADDVVKNESTSMSPASLPHSFEDGESFPYDPYPSALAELGSKEDGGGVESTKDVREISNTSLNTLGDDEDSNSGGSDHETDVARVLHKRTDMKRFDTISSNGESSYRPEEHNYPSVSEQPELEEYVSEHPTPTEDVFDTAEEERRLTERVHESASREVDQICEKAVQNVSEMLRRGEPECETKDGDDFNNYSESSIVLSVVDSVAAEKGSDYDSLSFLDEQSDSRSVSILGGDESFSSRGRLHEGAITTATTTTITATSVSPRDDAVHKRLHESDLSSEVEENTSNFSQEITGAVINRNKNISPTTIVNQVDNFPRPPSVEDLPSLPGNTDQYDIPIEELQSVESPANWESNNDNGDISKDSLEEAAAKIQAGIRGYLIRKQMKQLKNTNKEVGSIIGKKGEIIKRFRDESGAKINISDGTCPERIVAITGNSQVIYKALALICSKIEEFQDSQNQVKIPGSKISSVVVRVIIAASQCGSLIGKGGVKIKEIRDSTGANIQVSSELLANSTERTVTINGTKECVVRCLYHICCVMLESPPKGPNIPYKPKPNLGASMVLAGGHQAYSLHGLTNTTDVSTFVSVPGCGSQTPYSLVVPSISGISPIAVYDPIIKNGQIPAAIPHLFPPAVSEIGKLANPLSNLAALSISGFTPAATSSLNPAAIAALAANAIQNNSSRVSGIQQKTFEMTVPNDVIGCIIGKGGNKIAEIRQISGALIRISNCEDRSSNENVDRTITITGNAESVAIAQYLINTSLEQQKLNLFLQNNCGPGMVEGHSDGILAPIPTPFTSMSDLPQSPVKPANTFDATVPISEFTCGNLPLIQSVPFLNPCTIDHLTAIPTAIIGSQDKANVHKHNRTKFKPY